MKIATPRLSPKTKAALAVALALLLWIPQGISQDTQPLVTGHSTFYNGDSYDPCLASVAGIVRSRVMWFNDQVLVERYPGKGTFVYITEHGGEDPTTYPALDSDGVSYTFVDPNGAAWHVQELYIRKNLAPKAEYTGPGDSDIERNATTGRPIDLGYASAGVGDVRQYVWVVELAAQPVYDQFPGGDQHDYYNFLDLVDTCKFTNNTMTYRGTVNHTSGLGPSNGHETGAAPHYHDSWNADIYLGRAPVVTMSGVSTQGAEYETSWATNPHTTGSPSSTAYGAAQNAPSGQDVPDPTPPTGSG